MVQNMPPQSPAIEKPAELQYPFGGFVFSGSKASLAKLKAAGNAVGLELKPHALPGRPSSLMISGKDAFGRVDAIMTLWNKAANGDFGHITPGIISEPPPEH